MAPDDRWPRRDPERLAVRVPEHVVYRDFAEQTVALNLHTGRYHGLNETAGARCSRRCARRRPSRRPPSASRRRGTSIRGVLLADLLELCDGLESRGLIETHVAE